MTALVVAVVFVAWFAIGVIVGLMVGAAASGDDVRPPAKLVHATEDCSGVWLPWPRAGRPWAVRCDRCHRLYPATPRIRAAATADLELAQQMRALTLEGQNVLQRERERAS